MKYLVILIFSLLTLTAALAEDGQEVLKRVPENMKSGDFVFHVTATELRRNEVHFHVIVSAVAGSHPLDPASLRARLGFFYFEYHERISAARNVSMKADGPSLVCDFSVHAGWLIDSSLCFVLTSQPDEAAKPPVSRSFFPSKFWDADRCLRCDYDALRAYQKTPSFLSFGKDGDEIAIDLNGDGRPEKLLLGMVHAHWGHYSIFTFRDKKWHYIGDARLGENPHLARKTRHGWHDFTVDIEGSRGQVSRSYYRWDIQSHEYEEVLSREIRPMERDPSLDP